VEGDAYKLWGGEEEEEEGSDNETETKNQMREKKMRE